MSGLAIADSIQREIEAIDKAQLEMGEKKASLRDFILSDDFLKEQRSFDRLLSVWADALLSLVEATGTSFNDFRQGNAFLNSGQGVMSGNPIGEGMISKVEQSDFTLTKALVLVVCNAGVVTTIVILHGSWIVPVLFGTASLILPFFGQIVNSIKDLFKKHEKKLPSLNPLTNKISESITYMRKRYVSSMFLIKFQKSGTKQSVFDSQEDPALVDRAAQLVESLPSDFMSRIDDISVECNNEAFQRKKVLYSYWRNSSPPQNNPASPVVNA